MATLTLVHDPYVRAFDALAAGNVPELAAALEDARSRGDGTRPGRIVATLLCRADLSPRRVELLGMRCRVEGMLLARSEAMLPAFTRPTVAESVLRVEFGLLHDYAAVVLRACGPTWPVGVSPGVVAWALARVVSAA